MQHTGDEPRSLALPFNLDLFPVTAVTIVLAMGITAGWMVFEKNVDALFMHYEQPGTELLTHPWRFVTCILPHIGFIHILFNVVWMVNFGRRVEGRFGPAAMFGIICFTGATAGAASQP